MSEQAPTPEPISEPTSTTVVTSKNVENVVPDTKPDPVQDYVAKIKQLDAKILEYEGNIKAAETRASEAEKKFEQFQTQIQQEKELAALGFTDEDAVDTVRHKYEVAMSKLEEGENKLSLSEFLKDLLAKSEEEKPKWLKAYSEPPKKTKNLPQEIQSTKAPSANKPAKITKDVIASMTPAEWQEMKKQHGV